MNELRKQCKYCNREYNDIDIIPSTYLKSPQNDDENEIIPKKKQYCKHFLSFLKPIIIVIIIILLLTYIDSYSPYSISKKIGTDFLLYQTILKQIYYHFCCYYDMKNDFNILNIFFYKLNLDY